MDLTGKVLGNRYELIEKIGIGGMAVVYRARCKLLNRNVAVKVLRDDLRDDEVFIQRFDTESKAVASLAQNNIVSIYDVGQEGSIHYIVMEYVEGETLKEYMDRMGKLSWKEALRIAVQICSALAHAHKHSIIHRDIKPQNIIITRDGLLKVTDFGIARAPSRSTVMFCGSTVGSVHYFSPEQARGGYTDERSDIYSLGVVIYEMLAGKVPFNSDSPIAIAIKHIQEMPLPLREHNLSIPIAVENIVKKAMNKEQSNRYTSATEMLFEIKAVLSGRELDRKKKIDQTLIMPAIDVPILESQVECDKNPAEKPPEAKMEPTQKNKNQKDGNQKKERMALVAAISSALLLVSMLGFFVMSFMGFGFFADKGDIEVPNLKGLQIESVQEQYKDLFSVIELQKIESTENAGVILTQRPKAGTKIKNRKENIIEVEISRGIDGVKLKDYSKISYETAKIELEDLGFVVYLEKQVSEVMPPNAVIMTLPSAGTVVKPHSDIKIFVAIAPAPTPKETIAITPTVSPTPTHSVATPTYSAQPSKSPVNTKLDKSALYKTQVYSDSKVTIKANGVQIYENIHVKGDRISIDVVENSDTARIETYYDGVLKQVETIALK